MDTSWTAILCLIFIFDYTNSDTSDQTMEYKEKLDPIDYDDEDESFRNSESRDIYNPASIPKRMRYRHSFGSNEDMRENAASQAGRRPVLDASHPQGSPRQSVKRCPHQTFATDLDEIVALPCGESAYAATPSTWLPLENLTAPTTNSSASYVPCPLQLQPCLPPNYVVPSSSPTPVLQIIKSRNVTKTSKGSSILTPKLPFAVSIQKKGTHFATGVLVSRSWVLSSAKEFYHIRETIKLLRMRIGTVDCKRGGQLVPIKLIEIYPAYTYGDPNFDIALLKLATPIKEYDDVHPISWTDKDMTIFVVLYWPRIVLNGRKVPANAPERIKYNNIRVSTQDTVKWKTCAAMLQHVNVTLAKSSLCLKPIQTLHSKCMADAGAPVLSYTGLLGVTSSWNSPICHRNPKNSPIVVTRISSPPIRTWMKFILLQKKPRFDEEMDEIEHAS